MNCPVYFSFQESEREPWTLFRLRLDSPYREALRYRPSCVRRKLDAEARATFVRGALEQVREDLVERGFRDAVPFEATQKPLPHAVSADDYPEAPNWSWQETLDREKDALGLYLSGHPNDRYEDMSRVLRGLVPVAGLAHEEPLSRVQVAGTITDYDEKVFREGGRRASFHLEDGASRVLVRVPRRLVEPLSVFLSTTRVPVVVTAQITFPKLAEAVDGVEFVTQDPTLSLEHVVLLHEQVAEEARFVALRVPEKLANASRFLALQEACKAHPGRARVRLLLALASGEEAALDLPLSLSVDPSEAFAKTAEELFLSPLPSAAA